MISHHSASLSPLTTTPCPFISPDLAKTRVMELNASDERGIGVVRDKIKTFASAAVGNPVPGYPCPPYKLLILDEADAMTPDAQSALRRTMETHSRVTRFVFICNYVSRIIEPLASRCAKFRFAPLGASAMEARIATVCRAEGVELSPGALTELGRVAGGDLRRAITTLQSAVRLKGTPVQATTLADVAGAVPAAPVDAIVAAARGSFADLSAAVTAAADAGWPARGLLLGVQDALLAAPADVPTVARAAALTALANADAALVAGADERLQLLAAASAVRTAFRAAPITVV